MGLDYSPIAGFNVSLAYEDKYDKEETRLTSVIQTLDSASYDPGGNRAILSTC